MMNFIDFSRATFRAFVETLNGFGTYKNEDKRIIVANPFGKVYKWSLKDDGTIVQKEITYPSPSHLTDLDIKWLQSIARKKHWRGGVALLESYLSESDTTLDTRGIDPFFYAWMASRHYQMGGDTATETAIPEKVTEGEYNALRASADRLKCSTDADFSAVVVAFSTAKSNGTCVSVGTFVAKQSITDTALYDRCYDFVESQAPFVDGQDIADIAEDICARLIDLGVDPDAEEGE